MTDTASDYKCSRLAIFNLAEKWHAQVDDARSSSTGVENSVLLIVVVVVVVCDCLHADGEPWHMFLPAEARSCCRAAGSRVQ